MRVKVKYALPLAQMLLAVVSIAWFYRWVAIADRIYDVAGTPAPFDLILLINAPVSLARNLFYHINPEWSDAMYVASIGILWHWVVLNIDSWRERRKVFLFAWVPLRIAADVALIWLGPYCLWQFRNIDVAHFPWQWCVPSLASILLWSCGLPFIFGYDLIRCFRRKISRAPGPTPWP